MSNFQKWLCFILIMGSLIIIMKTINDQQEQTDKLIKQIDKLELILQHQKGIIL